MLERVVAMGVVFALIATAAAIVNADEAVPPVAQAEGDEEAELSRAGPCVIQPAACGAAGDPPEPKDGAKKARERHERDEKDGNEDEDEHEEREGKKRRGKHKHD